MAWLEIEGKRFRTESIALIYKFNGSSTNSKIRLKGAESMAFEATTDEVFALIEEAEEKERHSRQREKREDMDYLAQRIAENMVDLTRKYDEEREARETAKPKKPLKINP